MPSEEVAKSSNEIDFPLALRSLEISRSTSAVVSAIDLMRLMRLA
jgi:hypothetical protein